ncbi:uracil phosphoribosyltransferase [Methanobacterium alcaliphilum]|uniref:uracil phosphoribosyltransferase n=1 Tax=Methanobacterium alcaliphilum TaxID=392018 RepID=UPI00200AC2D7|nr:uracil phosphoribosyltransferase [Methanobacterium alcaliphilum]MCK9150569.1 uracil phosphoribosyltransferase [Methanobacterium alcaliphilum]
MLKIIDHLLVQEELTKIRKKGIASAKFRRGIIEIGRLLAYEFVNTLEKEDTEVETPLGMADGIKIKSRKEIVIITILRASLPLTNGILKVFPEAQYGVVGAWRKDNPPFDVCMDYLKIPDLTDKIVIVADPMLATGNTMELILKKLQNFGNPKRMVLFTVISSKVGIEKIMETHNELEIYTCSVEKELNNEGYIVPGLGDAGDIAFGKPFK